MVSPNEETILPPSHSKLQIYLQIKGASNKNIKNIIIIITHKSTKIIKLHNLRYANH